jgi:hypothetical protein
MTNISTNYLIGKYIVTLLGIEPSYREPKSRALIHYAIGQFVVTTGFEPATSPFEVL